MSRGGSRKRYNKNVLKEILAVVSNGMEYGENWKQIANKLNDVGLLPANAAAFSETIVAQLAYSYDLRKKLDKNSIKIKPNRDSTALRSLILDCEINNDTKIKLLKVIEGVI